MSYINRLSDSELQRKLNASGALLIRGAKACGKTESAKQFSGSILNVDRDEQVPVLMETSPQRLLLGKTPRLIDEWQEQPKLWNYIRHEIDNRGQPAQFILTGSANPEESIKRVKPPKSLNIITGTGISYTRADGINVISLASLGF